MNHASTIDELHHYLGQLRIDVMIGVDRRHLKCGSRLCWLLVDKLEKDVSVKGSPSLNQETFKALQIQLLDLQRAIDNHPETKPNPVARRVGKARVIEGQKREPKGVAKAAPRLRLVEP